MSNEIANLGIKIDSTDAEKASVDLDKLSQAGARTEEAAKKAQQSWQEAMKRFSSETASLGSRFDTLTGVQTKMLAAVEGIATQMTRMAGATDQAAAKTGKMAQEVDKSATALGKAGAQAREASAGLDRTSGSAEKAGKSADKATSSIGDMAVALGGVVSVAKLWNQIEGATFAAGRYEQIGIVMDVVGRNAGYGAQQLAGLQTELEKTGISMTQSRQVITQMIQAQMDLSHATQLARLAQDAATIGNMSSSDALQNLVYGVQTAQVEMLRNIGIVVSFENAYKKLAEELGTTTAALTEQEKMTARVNAVMEQGPAIAGAYEASMENANKAMGSMSRYADNLQVNLGKAFQPTFATVIDGMTGALKVANDNAGLLSVGLAGITASVATATTGVLAMRGGVLALNVAMSAMKAHPVMMGVSALAGVLTAGVAAWGAYRDSVDSTRKSLTSITDPLDELIKKFNALSKLEQQVALKGLADAVKEAEEELSTAFDNLAKVPLRLRNSPAIAEFRQELEKLKDADIGAAELDQQVSSLVESFKAANPQARAAFDAVDRLGIAVIDAARKGEKLVETQNALTASTQSVTTALDLAAIAAAKAAAGLQTEKWADHITKLELAAAAVGMTAQQVGELQARSMGASAAQAELAGVLYGMADTAKALEKATADKDAKAIKGAQDALSVLAQQEIQLRVNIKQAESYAALLAMGLSAASALQGSQTEAELEGLKAMEEVLNRLNTIRKNIADNTEPSKSTKKESEKATKAINDQIKALQLQAMTVGMTEQQITLYKLATEGATKAQLASAKAALDSRRAGELSLAVAKRRIDTSNDAIKAVAEEVRRNHDLAETFGMTASAVEQLTISRLEHELAREQAGKGDAEEIERLKMLIALRQESLGAIVSVEQKEAQKQQWESWARDVEQIFNRVGQSLTDAIFDGGKSAKDLLRDLFKGLTFNILINPVMNQLQGWVTNQLGGMFGYQNPAQGGGGVLGMAQNAKGAYDLYGGGGGGLSSTLYKAGEKMGSYALQNFAAGMNGFMPTAISSGFAASLGSGAAGTLGTSASAITNTTFSSSLSSGGSSAMAGTAGAAFGQAIPYIGALFAASQGQYATAAGTAIGTAIMPGIGTAIGAVVGALADSVLGDFGGETRYGGTYVYNSETGRSAHDGGWNQGNPGAEVGNVVNSMVESTAATINGILQAIDPNVYLAKMHGEVEDSEKGRGGVSSGGFIVGAGGVPASEVADQDFRSRQPLSHQFPLEGGIRFGTFQRGEGHGSRSGDLGEMIQNLAVDLQQSSIQALQSVSHILPETLQAMLKGIDADSLGAEQAAAVVQSIQAVVQGVQGFQAAVENLPFENLRDLSFDAAANLIAFAGGIDQLNAGMTTYFAEFYSQEEQLAMATQNMQRVFEGLGREMPDVAQGAEAAKAAYRGIVDSLDVTTEEGQRTYAALMNLSGGFAQLVGGMDQLAEATSRAAEEQRRAAQQIRDDALRDLSAAYNEVVAAGQREIARLQESFSATDTAMGSYRSAVQQLQSELNSLFAAIDRGVSALRGTGAAMEAQYNQARAVISTTLVTGQLPQTADLTEALRVAQQGVMGQRFASREDQQRAYLTLAKELEGIKGIAEPELDTAKATLSQLETQYRLLRGMSLVGEDSLKSLEAQLRVALSTEEAARYQISVVEQQIEEARRQYDALTGIDTSIKDLATAMREFAAAAAAARTVVVGGGGGSYPTNSTAPGSPYDRARDYYAENWDVANAWNSGTTGMTYDEFAQWHYEEYGRKEGRSYAVGTSFVPYDMKANIHKGEIIIDPKSSDILRRYGIGVQGGGTSRETEQLLREQLSEVRQQNRYLYEIVKSGKRTANNTEDTATAIAHGDSDGVVVVM